MTTTPPPTLRRLLRMGLVLATALAPWSARAEARCELRMGYRPEARLPLMAEAPSNDGVYRQLYERAAQQIGCTLRIERLPKLRILRGLQSGELDFYPGMDFDLDRDAYLLFVPNGLPGEVIGVSRRGLPPVRQIDELAGRRVLSAAGQPDRLQTMQPAARARVQEVRMVSAALDSAVDMLLHDRADFFVYPRYSVEALLAAQPDLRQRLALHPQCCGGHPQGFAGFAKASSHVRLQANPAHDPRRPLGPDNQRERSAPDSTAARFAQALDTLHRSGEARRLMRDAQP